MIFTLLFFEAMRPPFFHHLRDLFLFWVAQEFPHVVFGHLSAWGNSGEDRGLPGESFATEAKHFLGGISIILSATSLSLTQTHTHTLSLSLSLSFSHTHTDTHKYIYQQK